MRNRRRRRRRRELPLLVTMGIVAVILWLCCLGGFVAFWIFQGDSPAGSPRNGPSAPRTGP